MREPRFILPSGETVPKSLTNRHHAFYESPNYTDGRLRRLRNTSGFIIRLHIPVHKELHQEVEPPIVPGPQLTRRLLQYSEQFDPRTSQIEKFSDYISYLGYLSGFGISEQVKEEAAQLHDNFVEQAEFIVKGLAVYHATV